MELAMTLTSQTVQNAVREVGINPNYWYPVGWASQLQPGKIIPVVIWQQAIAVYRDASGQLHALEDACPHKGVALHKGEVQGANLLCAYHGWEFNGAGNCVKIPYLPETQKLPCAQVRSYPIQEKYNLIWVFPGEASLADSCQLPEVPEFGNPDWLLVPIPGHFQAHFSICNENAMDVFHGFLHKNLQGWFDPVLTSLRTTESSVCAEYKVSYKGAITQILGLSERGDRVTTRTVSVHYRYPHYYNSLEGVSSLYLMRQPLAPNETSSFSLLLLKVRLPKWLIQPFKPLIATFIRRFLFMRFLAQDIEMMENEQRTYLANPQRHYVEINPAIVALQRVIIRQYEQFMQKSNESPSQRNRNSENSISLSEAIAARKTELNQEQPIG
jgi:phenylpropionate dioxygenase-like ring-hydroxylating dioxygenase large terminal subunit